MKKISLLLFTALVITSCQNKQSFSVHGIIHGAKQNYIYLNRVNVNMLIPLDSSKISGTGKFKFKIKASEPDFYQVGFTKKDFINLLAEPGEKIKLDFAGNNLYSGYTVSGSKGSGQVRMLDVRLT